MSRNAGPSSSPMLDSGNSWLSLSGGCLEGPLWKWCSLQEVLYQISTSKRQKALSGIPVLRLGMVIDDLFGMQLYILFILFGIPNWMDKLKGGKKKRYKWGDNIMRWTYCSLSECTTNQEMERVGVLWQPSSVVEAELDLFIWPLVIKSNKHILKTIIKKQKKKKSY